MTNLESKWQWDNFPGQESHLKFSLVYVRIGREDKGSGVLAILAWFAEVMNSH